MTFLGLAATSAFVRLVVKPGISSWLLLVGAMAAAFYTHYDSVLLLPVQLIFFAILRLQGRVERRGLFAYLAAWPAIIAVFCHGFDLLRCRYSSRCLPAADRPVSVVAACCTLSRGGRPEPSLSPCSFWRWGVVASFVLQQRGAALWSALQSSRSARLALFLLFLGTMSRRLCARLLVEEAHRGRLATGLVLVGALWPWRRMPSGAGDAADLSFAGSLPTSSWCQDRGARRSHIRAHQRPNDFVWLVPSYDIVLFDYYAGDAVKVASVLPPLGPGQIPEPLDRQQRVWLVYSSRDLKSVDPDRTLEDWLSAHMQAVDSLSLHGVTVTLYQVEPNPHDG